MKHTARSLLLACLGLIISPVLVSAQCPARGAANYWNPATGTTVTAPVLAGGCWCVADFTYCQHAAPPPTEYHVASFTPHPGGGLRPDGSPCTCPTDARTVLEGIRNWLWFQKDCETWCKNPGDQKTVLVSHDQCYRSTSATPPTQSPCPYSGECQYSYSMTCAETFCEANFTEPPAPTLTGPGCPEPALGGCKPVCP